jgi:hypothetical protein
LGYNGAALGIYYHHPARNLGDQVTQGISPPLDGSPKGTLSLHPQLRLPSMFPSTSPDGFAIELFAWLVV